ncbi:TPA: hypothetical protein I7730_00405 [Vibrio vulnificus]|uniref:Uncharacterized protein n=1 Tax=Vibrio vulnificus TaxID=672 RepID=A0A8H9MZ45_VIBVL|nr:hypothetical protein [Vibrio vulnificus]HAS8538260.1 hypothetical protein [Vibrio vulnificus]
MNAAVLDKVISNALSKSIKTSLSYTKHYIVIHADHHCKIGALITAVLNEFSLKLEKTFLASKFYECPSVDAMNEAEAALKRISEQLDNEFILHLDGDNWLQEALDLSAQYHFKVAGLDTTNRTKERHANFKYIAEKNKRSQAVFKRTIKNVDKFSRMTLKGFASHWANEIQSIHHVPTCVTRKAVIHAAESVSDLSFMKISRGIGLCGKHISFITRKQSLLDIPSDIEMARDHLFERQHSMNKSDPVHDKFILEFVSVFNIHGIETIRFHNNAIYKPTSRTVIKPQADGENLLIQLASQVYFDLLLAYRYRVENTLKEELVEFSKKINDTPLYVVAAEITERAQNKAKLK